MNDSFRANRRLSYLTRVRYAVSTIQAVRCIIAGVRTEHAQRGPGLVWSLYVVDDDIHSDHFVVQHCASSGR